MLRLFLFIAGSLALLIGAAAYYVFFTGPPLHEPSDLSDFINTPDSPIDVYDPATIAANAVIERDVGIELRDGTRLSANVFRPDADQAYPVIMAFTAYHKDETPNQYPDYLRLNATPNYDSGTIRVSEWTPWEAPDPAYWVSQGYAVVIVDSRGYGLSEGTAGVLSLQDRYDFHDAITWAGTQAWSNGNVGLTGVSYLAIAQWIAAANAPDHLKAIMPWEGQSDNFREVLFHGGVPETAFTNFWLTRVRSKANKTSLPPHRIMRFAGSRPMLMKRVSARTAPSGISLPDITVPTLICASWSDHGMHTRGSFEGFKQISSPQKWVYTHGQPKWDVYYSDEAKAVQTAFFDHFLKGEANGFDQRPAVRLEVRDTLTDYTVRFEDSWPLASTQATPYYLAADSQLTDNPGTEADSASYAAREGAAVFRKTFVQDTELTGNMKLKLWVEADGARDMDLFVAIKKYDADGNEVTFYGKAGYAKTPVALGWLRVSQRELDPDRSTPLQPYLKHEQNLKLSRGDIVPVEVEILPSSTLFRTGETLEVAIQGQDHFEHHALAHENTVNKGRHIIHFGGDYDSYLLVPMIPLSEET